jgi:hypothetical protein
LLTLYPSQGTLSPLSSLLNGVARVLKSKCKASGDAFLRRSDVEVTHGKDCVNGGGCVRGYGASALVFSAFKASGHESDQKSGVLRSELDSKFS